MENNQNNYSKTPLILSILYIAIFIVFSISPTFGGIHQLKGEKTEKTVTQKCIPDIKKIEALCNEVNLQSIPFNAVNNDTLFENSYGESNSLFFVGANKLTIKFDFCTSNEAALIKMAQKINANQKKGLQIEKGIADEAISLTFKNELLQLSENYIILRKQNVVVELQAIVYSWSNLNCPCYNPNNLKLLATEIVNSAEFLPK